jgi:hypothetical protein
MIVICAEQQKSVIWIDPRGRQFRRTEFVPLVFGRVEEWQRLLAEAEDPICVHVLRTKTEVLTLDRAQHLSSSGSAARRRTTVGSESPVNGSIESWGAICEASYPTTTGVLDLKAL